MVNRSVLSVVISVLVCGSSLFPLGHSMASASTPRPSGTVVVPEQHEIGGGSVSQKKCRAVLSQIDARLREHAVRIVPEGIRFLPIDRHDNPTRRARQIMIVIGAAHPSSSGITTEEQGAAIAAVMESPELRADSELIMKSCTDVAVVAFGVAHSDYIIEFALDGNRVVFRRSCLEAGVDIIPSWRQQICL